MNSSKNGDMSNETKRGEEQHVALQDLKEETDDLAICEPVDGPGGGSPGSVETGKRTFMEMGSDMNQSTTRKRFRVSGEIKEQLTEESIQRVLPCLTIGDKAGCGLKNSGTNTSYRKPLFGISHRIIEKRITPSSEPPAVPEANPQHPHEGSTELLRAPEESGGSGEHEALPADGAMGDASQTDPGLYPLIEKMFFILNTLSSSMTQLHSKVDLLSLEVVRIKKQIEPGEMWTEFQPPPEYLLSSQELHQLMEQTSGAGGLGCRLLMHLFPELFKDRECANGCAARERTLDSLHLQLIRNYVEVCYPLVKNNNVWHDECLLQINDLFQRFWAQKDMDGARMQRKQTIVGTGIKAENAETYRFINEVGEEEQLPIDDQNNAAHSDLASDVQLTDDLDEFSSPEDFVVFLVHRLFPEIFEEGKFPESLGLHGVGQLLLESDRLEIIRKYMEANFPDVPEDTWLQLCVQHMEDAIESVHSNSNGGEHDSISNNSYDLAGIPEEISMTRIPNMFDHERPNRRSKKSFVVPVDFDEMEIPLPDFSVPKEYLLSREQLKSNYDCSLSIGNFASRILVLMFPELFTQENARKHYNCSGSLGKKQLDPVRVNLIRHYVQLLYPPAKSDRVWMFEFVGKLDERCRRRDSEQRRSYQQQRKVYGHEQDAGDAAYQASQFNGEGPRDEADIIPPAPPPEKSSKDFCKIPLEVLSVTVPDFPVPSVYLLSNAEVREVVQQSLSVGNFAARLLVRLFPELFTQENLRLQYNHSGACNKKQLDPVRLRLIRHYVEAVYPVDKMEEVWHYECVPSIDERCRRPNRKKCDILKQARRSSTVF